MKRFIFGIILITATGLAILGLPDGGGAESESISKEAVDFTLNDLSGKQVSLQDYEGKVVVLNFWATWCSPCRREMPGLEKLYQKYKDKDFQLLGIVVVSSEKDISDQVKSIGVSYPILLGDKKLISDYGSFNMIPNSFIIGRDGKILKQLSGSRTYTVFEKEVKKALLLKN